jgi:curved DNA-binding protein CbpA
MRVALVIFINQEAAMKLNAYELLCINHDANDFEIKRAFRREVRRCHPDFCGDAEEFLQLKVAYEILMDPNRRDILGDQPFFKAFPSRPVGSLDLYDRKGKIKSLNIMTT